MYAVSGDDRVDDSCYGWELAGLCDGSVRECRCGWEYAGLIDDSVVNTQGHREERGDWSHCGI